MGKHLPWVQWYADDWLNDVQLSKCRLATRGFWKDALARMILAQSGQLEGTVEQLAQLCRCSAAEARDAVNDLSTTGAADVSERNGIVTLTCRRLSRVAKLRQDNAKRQADHRARPPNNAQVTDLSLASNALDTRYQIPEAEKTNAMYPPRARATAPNRPPTLQDVLGWAAATGVSNELAELFWAHYESIGWVDAGGNPIVNPAARLAKWKAQAQAKGYLDRAGGSTAALISARTELERIEARMKEIRSSYEGHQTLDDKDRAEIHKLKARRAGLLKQLGWEV